VETATKNSAGVIIRNPVLSATAFVKCLVLWVSSQSGLFAIAMESRYAGKFIRRTRSSNCTVLAGMGGVILPSAKQMLNSCDGDCSVAMVQETENTMRQK
jgi:hypothetical protein